MSSFFIPKEFEELLKEHIPAEKLKQFDFSADQETAYNHLLTGKNLLLTGAGGSGKSRLIKVFIEHIQTRTNKTIYFTATTGIAAYNIGGITINSLLGIGTGKAHPDTLITKIKKQRSLVTRICSMDILIIDEISMMSAELFEKIHVILKYFRRDSRLFGGVQLLLSGDWYQLKPVFKEPTADTRLLYESEFFKKHFVSKNTINLKKNWRQLDDKRYANILSRIRTGNHTQKDIDTLKTRLVTKLEFPKDTVRLVSSNAKANKINNDNLKVLTTQKYMFTAEYSGVSGETWDFSQLSLSDDHTKKTCVRDLDEHQLELTLLKDLYSQLDLRGLNKLKLCEGARVMLVKNTDVERGLVNGAVGTVIRFEKVTGYPIVRFDNELTITIKPIEWELELGGVKVKSIQIPLMLSWASTIHKCQSLTLDRAVMDLSDCFTDGMVYVALSRVRRLKDVYLESFDESKITTIALSNGGTLSATCQI
jgi:ATP-dependent DNA helicase PIF1